MCSQINSCPSFFIIFRHESHLLINNFVAALRLCIKLIYRLDSRCNSIHLQMSYITESFASFD